MNISDYRRAMDRVTPTPELKERIMKQQDAKRRLPVRRAIHGVLAAAIAIACLFTAALAASPELRTTVLSFFRMEEREQVPNSSAGPDGPDISNVEIGQLVKAQYIKMDHRYGQFGSLFNDLDWSEDGRTLLSAKFWEVKDSELIPVDVDMQTSQIDVTFDGIRYQGELYWFVRKGELFFFKGTPYGVDTRPEDEWYVEAIPGRTDAVILNLAQGRQMDYTQYPVLCHLDTGETEDILADTGAAELEYAYSHLWSEDMRRVLISCGKGEDWLCDLDAKTTTRLEDLSGLEGNVFANFADGDKLVLSVFSQDAEGVYQDVTCYAFDLLSKQLVKTLDHTPYYHWYDEVPNGVQMFGSRCVMIAPNGQVQIIDLSTGNQTVLDSFTFRKGDEFMISPSGNKLLYYSTDSDAEGLGITQLGVIDLEKGIFIAFDREGYEDLHEEAIGWEDNNTVSINARTPDGETRYLLLYQF